MPEFIATTRETMLRKWLIGAETIDRAAETIHEEDQPFLSETLESWELVGIAPTAAIEPTAPITDALRVLTVTPHIRQYLAEHDPMALRQALQALGEPLEDTDRSHGCHYRQPDGSTACGAERSRRILINTGNPDRVTCPVCRERLS